MNKTATILALVAAGLVLSPPVTANQPPVLTIDATELLPVDEVPFDYVVGPVDDALMTFSVDAGVSRIHIEICDEDEWHYFVCGQSETVSPVQYMACGGTPWVDNGQTQGPWEFCTAVRQPIIIWNIKFPKNANGFCAWTATMAGSALAQDCI